MSHLHLRRIVIAIYCFLYKPNCIIGDYFPWNSLIKKDSVFLTYRCMVHFQWSNSVETNRPRQETSSIGSTNWIHWGSSHSPELLLGSPSTEAFIKWLLYKGCANNLEMLSLWRVLMLVLSRRCKWSAWEACKLPCGKILLNNWKWCFLYFI